MASLSRLSSQSRALSKATVAAQNLSKSLKDGEKDGTDGWDTAWKQGNTPWDAGKASPILESLIQQDKIPSGLCFVPGCGQGYDAIALASPERQVIGLDISPTVIEQNNKRRTELGISESLLRFECADFFNYPRPENGFQFIYDYTFLCAFPPSFHDSWADTMVRLLADDGELMTLIFPIGSIGEVPPYPISPELVRDLLEPRGLEAFHLEPVPHELSHGPRAGREALGRWCKRS